MFEALFDDFSLAPEALDKTFLPGNCGREHFHRHSLACAHIMRLVNCCHPAQTDLLVQTIVVKLLTDESCHTSSLRLEAH